MMDCYQEVCDYLTVGPYTRCIPARPRLPRGASERHILAVPIEPSIHTAVKWFLFANDVDLKSVFFCTATDKNPDLRLKDYVFVSVCS